MSEEKKEAKILLTAIFKDDSEAPEVERMLKSFLPYFDGLAVAITGPSKKHKKVKKICENLAKELKIPHLVISTDTKSHPDIYQDGKFANFAAARNASWELAEKLQEEHDFDWWAWADSDDVLVGGNELRQVAAELKDKPVDQIGFVYWYAVTLDNKGGVKDILIDHLRERLLRPGMFKWISRLHEVTVPREEGYEPKNALYDLNEGRKCVWLHLPDTKDILKNLKRNKEILEIQLTEEKGKDPRTLFYYAKVLIDLGKKEKEFAPLLWEAKDYLEKYLKTSGWEQERANALIYLSDLAVIKGDHQQAIDYLIQSIKEDPKNHITHLRMAGSYMHLGQFDKAEEWLNKAVNMEAPEATSTIGSPTDVKMMASSLKHNLAMAKNDLPAALHWIKVRQELAGNDESERIKMLEGLIDLNEATKWVWQYAIWLKERGHKEQLKALVEAVAPEMQDEAFFQHLVNEVVPPKVWPDKSIVYYTGRSFEDWSPKSLKKGVGGSESAVIYLSRLWAKKGYKVTVFCNCGDEAGTYDGVEYVHYNKMNFKDQFDNLIIWRNPGLADVELSANKILFDAHDQLSQTDWPESRMEKIDHFMFKTPYHRQMLPKVPDEKAVIIGNGIQL